MFSGNRENLITYKGVGCIVTDFSNIMSKKPGFFTVAKHIGQKFHSPSKVNLEYWSIMQEICCTVKKTKILVQESLHFRPLVL